ncbi:pyruvate, phosphate dikinase [Halobacteriovorax sp. JY17]|uniref:pyruvate, phosphate dikinase n=1 Tax=Halobacteriovorax sp. JY17 TaxID=2014617 RepID=UPI000C59130C|nr:pyruvate, phosphate dikinase [Halobacteriovorax sp. JY17]PIK13869.1 MAG: pyruvate, phosphate dikinase [Halobacteriovorax sp. JY17]
MATKNKWVYSFSSEKTEGNKEMKDLLGGKGANLAEMSSIGLSVPPGFTVTTEACLDFVENNNTINQEIKDQVLEALKIVEETSGKKFGDIKNPLLFSVRSGARVSMPGMMDTVLNLGLNDESVLGLAELTKNPRFAWDSYRRFIQMYANVVMGFNVAILESTLEDLKEAREVELDTQLSAGDLEELVEVYKRIIFEETGISFPTDPMDQLWRAVSAVFGSWNNPRAVKYREINDIGHNWGTAVNVQSMVFGNMGDDCATGVCFTRDPSTGEKKFFGEFLINAQGEDVVAGIRTPQPINSLSKNESNKSLVTLQEAMPIVYDELVEVYTKLEIHYKDMQDIEFTIEKDKLFILQTRNGKRTAAAAVKIAVDLVNEEILTKEEAILKINPEDINQLLHPRLDPSAHKNVLAQGLPASPGAGCGVITFTSEKATALHESGVKVMLVRQETSPEDIAGMVASEGILTARGGMTSHAAVVARGMGKPCVAGCSGLQIDYSKLVLRINGKEYKEGDFLTIDGATGEVIEGKVPTIAAEISEDFALFMSWADEFRKLEIRTNADNPEDSLTAKNFGAEGIGLCRTEHMFFEAERILAVREMIYAKDLQDREKALAKLLPFQREDFIGIFTAMSGKPVNIRLLDPPLHEFLPHSTEDREALAEYLELDVQLINERCEELHEFNPMLGHRGCRLGVTYPEIYRMQTRAIIEAAIECKKNGVEVFPEIMIPLISLKGELVLLKRECIEEINLVFEELKTEVKYKLGTMIELPRAAITAGKIAPEADFFSFGTNDLTQTTFGLSRDDSGKFLPEYVNGGLMTVDPFVSLDREGVGFLVNHACVEGRKSNPQIHVGICGEHGGEPKSIQFCHEIGLDYVSCSPYRVPIARLAAAQAALRSK